MESYNPDPAIETCNHCDFGSGQRGMDLCGRCGGTGLQFVVSGWRYPNTERGYYRAMSLLYGARVEP